MVVSAVVINGGKLVVVGREHCGLLMMPNQVLAFADAQNLASFQDSGRVGMYSIGY